MFPFARRHFLFCPMCFFYSLILLTVLCNRWHCSLSTPNSNFITVQAPYTYIIKLLSTFPFKCITFNNFLCLFYNLFIWAPNISFEWFLFYFHIFIQFISNLQIFLIRFLPSLNQKIQSFKFMGLKKNMDQKRGIIWSSLVARAKLLLQLESYALELEIVINLQVEANIANGARKVGCLEYKASKMLCKEKRKGIG